MRIEKILLAVVAILATSWLFNSCTKDASFEEISVESKQENQDIQSAVQLRSDEGEGSNEEKVILGEKRNNPFALANINQAKASLYGTSIPDKVATHKYIKFLPGTQEHLAVLEDWETGKQIPLFDFPLEYEVISGGETYLDPSVSDSLFTYQYAVIPNEVELPDVPNEVIDDLHLDKSDPLLIAESFWLTDNKKDINEYVFPGRAYEGCN